MNKTTVYFPSELQRGVESLSKRTGMSQAAIIREAVTLYLQQQGRPRLRSLGVAKNSEVSGRNAREWLEKHWEP
jgi:hypothetical protein